MWFLTLILGAIAGYIARPYVEPYISKWFYGGPTGF